MLEVCLIYSTSVVSAAQRMGVTCPIVADVAVIPPVRYVVQQIPRGSWCGLVWSTAPECLNCRDRVKLKDSCEQWWGVNVHD
ncbi:hypothetical protein BDZ94DRAFT_1243020 [Collybia nuda]|uniref:Uncharacterized protein n=1 Tax=Collybia nuda TaxID=64659 RepID=A0A9P6CK87_9AGAR|nr:hypothetical protein BDZ94DRAFT_1243020 [Collybia nuda]